MPNVKFSELVKRFRSKNDFDHPDVGRIINDAKNNGTDPLEAGKAFMVARDLESLADLERLEGGDGTETKRTDPEELKRVNFRKR